MSAKDLSEALAGPKGSLDGYLEIATEAEVRADIIALTGTDERRRFAAMAMQGMLANNLIPQLIKQQKVPHNQVPEWLALGAVEHADALIAELAKVTP